MSLSSDGIIDHIRRYYGGLYAGRFRPGVKVLAGRGLAEHLGYPERVARAVPAEFWEYFHPCGNPLNGLDLAPGTTGLNLGCGVGIDSIAVAMHDAAPDRIVNLDMVPGILATARRLYDRVMGSAPAPRVLWVNADGRGLPFGDSTFDWILMNGVFNLFPDKAALLDEIARAAKPGGRLVVADLCSKGRLPDYFRSEPDAWAWCMSGALTVEAMEQLLAGRGFLDISVRIEEECEDLFDRAVIAATLPKE